MKKRDLILLALGQTLVWAGIYYVFPALLLNWEEMPGWSRKSLTGAFTVALFVSACASPVTGRIIDAGLGPLLMAICTAGGGIALLILSQVQDLLTFYALWAFLGLMMAGALYEPCFALITRALGSQARPAIVTVTLIAGFASTLSFPAAHTLSEFTGWRTALQIFGGIVILAATPLMWFGANSIEKHGQERRLEEISSSTEPGAKAGRSWLRKPVFWFLGCGFALAAIVHGVTLHHLLPILSERGVADAFAVTIVSLIGPMQVAGRLAIMSLNKHLSNHVVALTCFSLLGVSIVLLVFAGSTPWLLVSFVLCFGSGYGIVSIVRPVIARDLLGEASFGYKSGSLALLYLAGAASAPWLGSVIWNAGGYELVLPALILLAVSGVALYCLAQHRAELSDDTGLRRLP